MANLGGKGKVLRYLWQGEPMSPFLFMLVVDVFSRTVVKGIEKSIPDFFWEGVYEGESAHFVRWVMVEKTLTLGGLDLENLRVCNGTLFAKLL